MKKLIEKIVDEILELVAGSFEIDPCNLKDEDLFTDAPRLGAAAGSCDQSKESLKHLRS